MPLRLSAEAEKCALLYNTSIGAVGVECPTATMPCIPLMGAHSGPTCVKYVTATLKILDRKRVTVCHGGAASIGSVHCYTDSNAPCLGNISISAICCANYRYQKKKKSCAAFQWNGGISVGGATRPIALIIQFISMMTPYSYSTYYISRTDELILSFSNCQHNGCEYRKRGSESEPLMK